MLKCLVCGLPTSPHGLTLKAGTPVWLHRCVLGHESVVEALNPRRR